MTFAELFFTAVGLSMDAFAVSICLGLCTQTLTWKNALTAGLYFGGFQALMPLAGYWVGALFADRITAYDHWIAFFLLAFIGGKMVAEGLSPQKSSADRFSLRFRDMLPLAVATSVDALAVGVSFAFLKVSILPAICFIGVVTLLFSIAGTKLGNAFGDKHRAKAELAGGVILVLIGGKILFSHLGRLPF